MKTINIKGKEYVTVNERLIYFRSQDQYANWQIHEDVVSIDDNGGIFKVTICDQDGVVRAMAHAQEDKGSSYINKTSFLENGFTSALGRALGYLGIGIDTSIASADEVNIAVKKQDNPKRQTASAESAKIKLIEDSDNWKKVLSYLAANANKDYKGLLDTLRTKYTINSTLNSKLKKYKEELELKDIFVNPTK